MVWVPVISATVPSGSKRMSTFSRGAPPVALMWQAKPRPRSFPRAALAARRAAKPATSARARARSKWAGKSPLSTVKPSALVIGIAAAGTRLRRRRAMRSKPHWRAAASISRSMIAFASAKPGPRRTPIGAVLVNTAAMSSATAGMA